MDVSFLNDGSSKCRGAAKVWVTGLFIIAGALIVWSSYIHFHLWLSLGYRNIPTINTLFLVQSLAGVVLALIVMLVRRVWAAVLGAGFVLSTLAGFLISVHYGLFGFKDYWSAPFAHVAFDDEVAAIVVLVIAATISVVTTTREKRRPART